MNILLEEAPLLVYYFLTPFLSNYKLRLILSIFWTTSTFCQLPLTCSLTSFVRLALPSLRCGPFAAHLLTHFVRSLVRSALANARAIALTSFAIVDSLVPSISIATCEFAFRFAQYNSRSRGRPSNTFLNVHSLC